MKDAKCKICGNNLFTHLCEGEDRFCFVEGNFDLYKCDKCGLVLILPYLKQDTLGKYYPSNYYSYSDTERMEEDKGSLVSKIKYYLKHPVKAANCLLYSKLLKQKDLVAYEGGMNVLDIGCGDGRYLLGKRKYGCNCFGVDIGEDALNALKISDPEIITFCGDLWETEFPTGYFDVINMTSVLEHVVDINKLLAEIHRILSANGVLKIQVPNSGSMTRKIFGKYWMGLDAPRHVYTFSSNNLRILFDKMNFEVHDFRTVENSYDLICSVIYVYNAIFEKKHEVMKLSKIWDSELLKLLLFPYAFLVNILKIGDSVEIILKKGGIDGRH